MLILQVFMTLLYLWLAKLLISPLVEWLVGLRWYYQLYNLSAPVFLIMLRCVSAVGSRHSYAQISDFIANISVLPFESGTSDFMD